MLFKINPLHGIMAIFLVAAIGVSCNKAYYNFWEQIGYEKRDLLTSNVKDANEDQKQLEKHVGDTLTYIRKEFKAEEGALERVYDRLRADYEEAQAKSDGLDRRIRRVETIASDLFKEWKQEAEQFQDPEYKKDSLQKRSESMRKFANMHLAMKDVQKQFQPILLTLKDQVMYLKHNLNAKALGVFKGEFQKIEKEFALLSKKVQTSIGQGREFIKEMK